jgi:hypothetical protein
MVKVPNLEPQTLKKRQNGTKTPHLATLQRTTSSKGAFLLSLYTI